MTKAKDNKLAFVYRVRRVGLWMGLLSTLVAIAYEYSRARPEEKDDA